ncbi:MAG: hypothetical protein AB7I18_01655 [Candidatus Berkiella sp.]
MKRVFILVPDLIETSSIAKEFEASGVHEEDIHVCAHINQELKDVDLQPANIFQMTNLGYAIKFGPLMGLVFVGLILVLCYFVFPLHISALGYAAIFLFGIGFGIWASGLIGLGVKNPIVEKYENYVSEGHYLMLVDLKPEKEKLTRQILAHHPRSKLAEQPLH